MVVRVRKCCILNKVTVKIFLEKMILISGQRGEGMSHGDFWKENIQTKEGTSSRFKDSQQRSVVVTGKKR